MPNKRINGRIINKHDTAENWGKATNFIPLEGEIIAYDPDETTPYSRLKVGDGVNTIENLPFIDDSIRDIVLIKNEQTLTDDELAQVRQNLRFIGKNLYGNEYTIDGKTMVASDSAEIFGDYDTNIAIGQWSIAEGSGTKAIGRASHAEGAYSEAIADGAHVEGYQTKATGYWSHAEGEMTTVSSYASHAEGSYCTLPDGTKRYGTASGYASHVEGGGCHTTASCSHAEGLATTASGAQSHVEGRYTIAAGGAQHVEGIANIEDAEGQYVHIAGNGTWEQRSNAHTLDWDGNAWFEGDIYVGSTSGINKDDGSKKLATEDFVTDKITTIAGSQSEFTGATEEANGVKGVVPAPLAGEQDKYLCADGTWSDIILPGEETTTETIGSMEIHVDTADTAYDSEKLGGVLAEEYALKSDLESIDVSSMVVLKRVQATVPADGWAQQSTGRYTQTVQVSDLTSHSVCHHADVNMSGVTEETAADIKQAWSMIDNIEATDAGVVFTSFTGAPQVDFNVYIDIEEFIETVPNANGVIF